MLKAILNFLLCSIFIVSSCSKSSQKNEAPPPTVIHTSHLEAGWYNKNAQALNIELDNYLTQAQKDFPVQTSERIKALIAPHAGYFYSGLCAATAYQALLKKTSVDASRKNTDIKRVIVLAPSHTTFYNGIALPNYTIYQTLFGNIPVDYETLKKLKKCHVFREYEPAHTREHAIEMQLPFLQKTVADFSLVPLVVGFISPEDCICAAVELAKIIDESTLIVVSSDFIHHGNAYEYKPFDTHILDHVRMLDGMATQAISETSLSSFEHMLEQTGATICGREPLRILLTLFSLKGQPDVTAKLGCYYTSAHTTEARLDNARFDAGKLLKTCSDAQAEQSVSYVSMILEEKNQSVDTNLKNSNLTDLLTGYEKKALLHLARSTLENAFSPEEIKTPESLLCPIMSSALQVPCGAFVTLNTHDGELRGCIGRITTHEPLFKTVHDMTLAAALQDSRFSPVSSKELAHLNIEVSILTKPRIVSSHTAIELGKHGIILNKQDSNDTITNSAVFLAHVPTSFGWTLEQTLEQLSLKAGLSRDAWKECNFEVFEEIVIKE